ncbi:MAG: hypothetical protein BWK80_63110 [Desulfobacteraceae bacterium IS3]|nr:MAG: hypothetical protein BWK80_63110 [Desulfobacteraceae bacterium IS3]
MMIFVPNVFMPPFFSTTVNVFYHKVHKDHKEIFVHSQRPLQLKNFPIMSVMDIIKLIKTLSQYLFV